MFKIMKSKQLDRYDVYSYNFIREANFYSFLYSAVNIEWDDVAYLLNGRVKDTDDIEWAHSIVRLTNQAAVITDEGKLMAVPVGKKGIENGKDTSDTAGVWTS